jgi:DNA-binding protein
MTDVRIIYVGRKPVHVYVAAVLNAMQGGERNIEIVARGNAMQRAIDTAEICRRHNGHLASMLPPEVNVLGVEIGSEEVEREDRTSMVSVVRISIEGIGDMPSKDEE